MDKARERTKRSIKAIISLDSRVDEEYRYKIIKLELEHLRADVSVLERTCNWNRPVNDFMDATLRELYACNNQAKQLKNEVEHL